MYCDEPRPGADWDAFRAARNRFFARVRPEAMDDPPPSICPDGPPHEWTAECRHTAVTGPPASRNSTSAGGA